MPRALSINRPQFSRLNSPVGRPRGTGRKKKRRKKDARRPNAAVSFDARPRASELRWTFAYRPIIIIINACAVDALFSGNTVADTRPLIAPGFARDVVATRSLKPHRGWSGASPGRGMFHPDAVTRYSLATSISVRCASRYTVSVQAVCTWCRYVPDVYVARA